MSWWDIPFILYAVGVGYYNYQSDDVEGFGSWLVRTVLLSALVCGPYFFWDEISAYWSSSSDGPVDINTGWW